MEINENYVWVYVVNGISAQHENFSFPPFVGAFTITIFVVFLSVKKAIEIEWEINQILFHLIYGCVFLVMPKLFLLGAFSDVEKTHVKSYFLILFFAPPHPPCLFMIIINAISSFRLIKIYFRCAVCVCLIPSMIY